MKITANRNPTFLGARTAGRPQGTRSVTPTDTKSEKPTYTEDEIDTTADSDYALSCLNDLREFHDRIILNRQALPDIPGNLLDELISEYRENVGFFVEDLARLISEQHRRRRVG